jgi:hypothetical protein
MREQEVRQHDHSAYAVPDINIRCQQTMRLDTSPLRDVLKLLI